MKQSFPPLTSKWFYVFLAYCIALHVLYFYTEPFSFRFNPKWYFLPEYAYHENFWTNIWHLHNNPPWVNILHGLIVKSGLPIYIVYAIIYSFLHLIASYWMYRVIQKINVPKPLFWLFLFMGNPVHIYWFHHYYYPALLFFFSSAILFIVFASSFKLSTKYILTVCILALLSMTRASYHPFWILFILIPWLLKIPRTMWVKGLIPLLIPLGWYTKNYVQYGFWGSSSWFGQNISSHIAPDRIQQSQDFIAIPRFSLPPAYKDFINENSPLIKKYSHIKFLNDTTTLHNIRIIQISKQYKEYTLNNLSIKYSAATIAYGFFSYFGSPLCDEMYNKKNQFFQWNNTWLVDWFDLPNIHIYSADGKYSILRLSWYLPMYIISLIWLLLHWKKQTPFTQFIILWLIIVSCIYCTIDPNESQRMRYETEPLFYFITLLTLKTQLSKKSF